MVANLIGILILVVSIFMILLILVQRGKGGGLTGALGGMGGQSAFGTRAGDLFTRITVVTAIIWISLCLVLIAVENPPPEPVNKKDPTIGAPVDEESSDETGADEDSVEGESLPGEQPPLGKDGQPESPAGGADGTSEPQPKDESTGPALTPPTGESGNGAGPEDKSAADVTKGTDGEGGVDKGESKTPESAKDDAAKPVDSSDSTDDNGKDK
jgi:preprotein translocase subunit SecG